uniref:Calpain catalytic domain-containing protein n=1 Tax=Anopheles farauti TaxID=69004 RepID=A0A182QLV0_9DIPT
MNFMHLSFNDADEQRDDGWTIASEESPSKSEHFYSLRARCLAEGSLYEDLEFPANDFSIYRSELPPGDSANVRPFAWKRPGEISDQPKFVTEGYSRFDVTQGSLGNCWFISSCASLTSHPELFERVVPQDNGEFEDEQYAGLFHFYFWQYGQWVEVIVDDRLPVTEDNQLLYICSSVANEFWGALVEKAYAKLHGSYEALISGRGLEGMVDLTGGITEHYTLKGNEPEDLFEIVESNLARRALITAGIKKDEQGKLASVNLVGSHEYSVSKVYRLEAKKHLLDFGGEEPELVKLICVRNPWGGTEWTGAWSDSSIEWMAVIEEKMAELNAVKEDGEFWMEFADFVSYFDDISMCRQCPSLLSEQQRSCHPWELLSGKGAWRQESTAGGSDERGFWKNPQFFFKLTAKNSAEGEGGNEAKVRVSMGLMQKHNRTKETRLLPMQLLVYPMAEHVTPGVRNRLPRTFFENVKPVECDRGGFKTLREIVVRYTLPPGRYVVVPHTWKPGKEGEFLLRVFSEGSLTALSSRPTDVKRWYENRYFLQIPLMKIACRVVKFVIDWWNK